MNFSEQLKIIQKEKKLKYFKEVYSKSTVDGFIDCVKILQRVCRNWLKNKKIGYKYYNSIINEQNIEYLLSSSRDYVKENKEYLNNFLYSYYYLVIWCKQDSIFDVLNYFYDNLTYSISTKYYDDEILLKKIDKRTLRVFVFFLRYDKYDLPIWINIPKSFRDKFIQEIIQKLQ